MWPEVLVLMNCRRVSLKVCVWGGRSLPHCYLQPQGPGGAQLLEGTQILAELLPGRANGMLQSALVLGGGRMVIPDGDDSDGGCEKGLALSGV